MRHRTTQAELVSLSMFQQRSWCRAASSFAPDQVIGIKLSKYRDALSWRT
jgi:hypothetical protein